MLQSQKQWKERSELERSGRCWQHFSRPKHRKCFKVGMQVAIKWQILPDYIPATWEVQYLSPTAPSPHNQVHELCLTRRGETWNLPQAPISLAPRVSEALSLSVCYSIFFKKCHSLNPFNVVYFYHLTKKLEIILQKEGKIFQGNICICFTCCMSVAEKYDRVFCLQLKHRDVSHNPSTSSSFISSLSHYLFRV